MIDVVCVGETMALVTPDPVAPLARGGPMRLDVAGAESTVACYLAQLGVRAGWVSRLGDDPLGSLVLDAVSGYGVDVTSVVIDPARPTGVFFKDPGPAGPRVFYYRAGSAASFLDPDISVPEASITHLSGITPALSPSCAALVDHLLATRRCSFDVNYRSRLWLDEAETLWGVTTPAAVRALLSEPDVLVVKDGAVGATAFVSGEATFEPARQVDVVEPVGAGDAFAAGYLAGLIHDLPVPDRLRLGHRVAGAALQVTGDIALLEAIG
jgi:2-dehydro-3-deoxygluconokinase